MTPISQEPKQAGVEAEAVSARPVGTLTAEQN